VPPFRFRLAKVLEWYVQQCRVEEDRLHQRSAALSKARAELADTRQARSTIESELMEKRILPAPELLALSRYRHRAVQIERRLADQLAQREREWREQLLAVQQARRRVRLLEKIRERKLQEHSAEADRELEELAADAFRAAARASSL
jgi:hypothetical protein